MSMKCWLRHQIYKKKTNITVASPLVCAATPTHFIKTLEFVFRKIKEIPSLIPLLSLATSSILFLKCKWTLLTSAHLHVLCAERSVAGWCFSPWTPPTSQCVHAILFSLMYFASEGGETHSHKLQRWCSRREWHESRWVWCLCRSQWRLHSCRQRKENDSEWTLLCFRNWD